MRDFPALKPRQNRALVALLEAPTIQEAAETVGVASSTLRRWLRVDTNFIRAYSELRREAARQVVARLQKKAGVAVDVLHSLMTDKETPPAVRVACARAVLEFSFRGLEILDLNERVEALEAEVLKIRGRP